MTRVDWIALAIVALSALSGLKRGLIATAFSLGGLALGAIIGARVAPHVLHGGSSSPYTPLSALIGAAVGAIVFQTVASLIGSMARGSLSVIPPLRALDTLGGLAAGALLGLGLVWVCAAVALQVPGQTKLRREVQQSKVLQRLNEIAPPRTILRAFARVDPFPTIAGPAPPSLAPDPRVLSSAFVHQAHPSVVKIEGVACGLGVEGSGWVARPHVVVTAAHVVAGAKGITANGHRAIPLVVDRTQDVAVLRVPGLRAAPLEIADPQAGSAVAILGYPENGPFDARPARVGSTADVLVNGHLREVTVIRGVVRHGNSGGPVVNERGAAVATVFAARIGSPAGYAIPAQTVRRDLAKAKRAVSTGDC